MFMFGPRRRVLCSNLNVCKALKAKATQLLQRKKRPYLSISRSSCLDIILSLYCSYFYIRICDCDTVLYTIWLETSFRIGSWFKTRWWKPDFVIRWRWVKSCELWYMQGFVVFIYYKHTHFTFSSLFLLNVTM